MLSKETKYFLLKVIDFIFDDIKQMSDEAHSHDLYELEEKIKSIKQHIQNERSKPGGWLDLTKQQYIDLFNGVIDDEKIQKRVSFIDDRDGFINENNIN